MPWEVTGPVKERTRFIEAYLTGFYTLTELSERFGVSRQKLHKWLARHNADGMKGLADRFALRRDVIAAQLKALQTAARQIRAKYLHGAPR